MGEISEDTDVVIITAGASGQEGADRLDMDFDPDDKEMLLESIALAKKAGKKIILLLNVAGPVELMPYMQDLDALVCMFFPGMAGARAVADILFGAVSPSGKLPLTFPKTYRDCPSSLNFPGEFGEVTYGEGIFVGYRYYDYKGIEPLFPFGFGLTYTDFAVTDVSVSAKTYDNKATEPLRIQVTVKNTGKMAAKEVIQLYVKDVKSTLQKPDKELKDFAKGEPAAREKKSWWNSLCCQRILLPTIRLCSSGSQRAGEYELMVGDSSRHIFQTIRIRLTGRCPYDGISMRSSCAQVAGCAKAMEACAEIFGEAFEKDTFLSQDSYFGGTPFKAFLEQRVLKAAASTKEQEQELLQKLISRLEKIEITG